MARLALLPIVTLTALAGCQSTMIETPAGYAKLQNPDPFDAKAVSPEGTVIVCESRPNEGENTDLAFWSAAIEHQKVNIERMRLARREEIKSDNGLNGMLFEFELGRGQGQVTWLLAVFVRGNRVLTAEAAGTTNAIEDDRAKLLAAIRSIR